MRFENTGIEELKADLNRLDEVMGEYGLVRAGQWDYERVTYDRKFDFREGVYYLRVQGYTIEGDVDTFHATIQLMTPIVGKHYYPHGIEYGEDENYPVSLITQCKAILEKLRNEITQFTV